MKGADKKISIYTASCACACACLQLLPPSLLWVAISIKSTVKNVSFIDTAPNSNLIERAATGKDENSVQLT